MTKQKIDLKTSVTPMNATPVRDQVEKDRAKELLNILIKEETQLVKGVFKCFETPGATIRLQIRKYPGIPPFDKTMTDGNVYEVPLYIARHLNGIDAVASHINGRVGTCSYPIHGFKWEGEGAPRSEMGVGPEGQGGIPVPIVGIQKRIARFGFQSLEFGAFEK